MQCSQCGSEVQSEFQFCPTCGHPFPSQTEPEGPAPTAVDFPSGPDWILAITSGNDQGSSYPFVDTLVIGREDDCDVILNDDRASRRHATIERTGEDSFRLVDHGSTNGTFVNEERVEGTAILVAGTPFSIGATVMSLVPTFETCARCGQSIEGSITFCGNCGHPIGTEVEIDLEAMAAEIEQATSREMQPSGKPAAEFGPAVPSVQDTPVSAAAPQEDLEETPPPRFKLPRRGLLIGCGVLLLLGIVTACCVSTVGTDLLEWLLDLLYEIQYMF